MVVEPGEGDGQPRTRPSWLPVAVLLAAVWVIALTGCSIGSEPATSSPSTVRDLEDLSGPGYEMVVEQQGSAPHVGLSASPTVGQRRRLRVVWEQEGLRITALLGVEVVASAADGSTHTVSAELLSIEADDRAVEASLQAAIASGAELHRNDHWVIVDQRLDLSDGLGSRDEDVVRQLLVVPFAHQGPVPAFELGQGAVWVATVRDGDARTVRRHRLVAVDDAHFEIAVDQGEVSVEYATGFGEAVAHRLVVLDTEQAVRVASTVVD